MLLRSPGPATRRLTSIPVLLLVVSALGLLSRTAAADPIACLSFVQFCTDGRFNGHNGGSPTNEGPEWAGPNVAKATFPRVGQTGGSVLYVGQGTGSIGPETLYLLYDYVAGPDIGFGQQGFFASFFDVFFELPNRDEDYLIRMLATGGFQAYEKDSGVTSPLTPQGNFDVGSPIWSPVSATDLALARFQTAVSFGPSPNSPTPHPIAEFELSINRIGQPGIYDPSPAFWSASVGSLNVTPNGPVSALEDPPISSAIFTLGPPFGQPTITPVLGPTGGPIQQPGQNPPVPEPAMLTLIVGGLAASVARRRQKR
jgi:hypothetical protein